MSNSRFRRAPPSPAALCENQAFAWRKNGLALQFHAEATARGLTRWLIGHVEELSTAGVDIRALRAESEAHAATLTAWGQAFLDAWLSQCGL